MSIEAANPAIPVTIDATDPLSVTDTLENSEVELASM